MREALKDLVPLGENLEPARLVETAQSEVAPIRNREPRGGGLLPTPGIKADVPVWGTEAGKASIFIPEGSRCQAMASVFVFIGGRSEDETSSLKRDPRQRPRNIRKKTDQGV